MKDVELRTRLASYENLSFAATSYTTWREIYRSLSADREVIDQSIEVVLTTLIASVRS